MHPRLFADPRRPAGDGRRRHAPRQADRPPRLRRGDRDPGGRLPPRARVRDIGGGGDSSRSVRAHRAFGRTRARRGPRGHGRRADDGSRGRESELRLAHRHSAPGNEDRRADRLRGRIGRDPRPSTARGTHRAARLFPRSRPRLPDRRRHPRRRGRRSGGGQEAAQGRRRAARKPSSPCSASTARASRRTC